MKLGLTTYWGSPRHVERLVEFAQAQKVDRIVYAPYDWVPWLFPKFPSVLIDEEKRQREICWKNLEHAARLTAEAGMEFWFYYVVLMVPNAGAWREIDQGLFTPEGEPDMANPKIYDLIIGQIDELLAHTPQLTGIELWIEEGADTPLSRLKHQSLSIGEIVEKIVETVHAKCRRHRIQFDIDLHVGGGDRSTVEAILAASRKRPDLIVSADDTIGDLHLLLPFNSHLWRAAVTNPVQVHFDVNGEYWGRNIYPTCGLGQYVSHLNEARALGASCVNGRVMAFVDRRMPYANILPSRRRFYPELEGLRDEDAIPREMEISVFDTLGGFNAEFFCRYARDPSADAGEVVQEFLKGEFGRDLPELAEVLMEAEGVGARVFYAGQNYFGAQCCLPPKEIADFFGNDVQFVTRAGEIMPLPLAGNCAEWGKENYYIGWPVSTGYSIGPHALIQEKQAALRDARDLLSRAEQAVASLPPESQRFVLRHFEDFVSYAEAAAILLEAMVHYYHLCQNRRNKDIPDRSRIAWILPEMLRIANAWEKRQPHDEWKTAKVLREWHERISRQ